jgi:hypothetical protein
MNPQFAYAASHRCVIACIPKFKALKPGNDLRFSDPIP